MRQSGLPLVCRPLGSVPSVGRVCSMHGACDRSTPIARRSRDWGLGLIGPCVPIYSPDLRRRRSLHLPQAQKVRPTRTPFLTQFSQKLDVYLISLGDGFVSELYFKPFLCVYILTVWLAFLFGVLSFGLASRFPWLKKQMCWNGFLKIYIPISLFWLLLV